MIKDRVKKIYKAKIIQTKKVAAASYFLELEADVPIEVKAGQFISIYCNGLTLRRPFSVFSNHNGKIGILFKEKGQGTKYIKSLQKGDFVDLIGPFGNSFIIENKKSLLVGAGIGIAPISYLKTKLDEKNIENYFICGFQNKNEIPDGIRADKICTDDGSFGEEGSVINYIQWLIESYNPDVIYACGPYIVLKNIAQLGIKNGIETQVAMEKVMACGIGVCRGCVINIKKNGETVNAAVCKDGPVFKGSEVVWS